MCAIFEKTLNPQIMSKKVISFSYLFAFVIACFVLNSIENKKTTNENYSDVNKEMLEQQQVIIVFHEE